MLRRRETYDLRCQQLGYPDYEQATKNTAHLSLRQASAVLGIHYRTIATERRRLGVARPQARPLYLSERAQLAAAAGFSSWEQALDATMDLDTVQAAHRLGLSPRKVYLDRIRHGLVIPRKRVGATDFDPGDPKDRQHGLRGYRRECRCIKCRTASARRAQITRQLNVGKTPPTHGINGYSNYGCRCEECVRIWKESRRTWSILLPAGP